MKHAMEIGAGLRDRRGTYRSVVVLVLVGIAVQASVVSSAAYSTGVHAGGSAEYVSVSQGSHRSAPKTSHPSSQKLWTFGYTTCATSNGVVRCWGSGLNPVFGLPSVERQSLYPTPTITGSTLPNLTDLSSYVFYACGVSNGGVKCWGEVRDGVIGSGPGSFIRTPMDISGLTSGVTSVAVGNVHACAVANSSLRCWGALDPFNNYRSTRIPTVVAGFENGVEAIVGGNGNHYCVLIRGGVKCAGYNGDGQLGDGGTQTSYSDFVDVVGLPAGSGSTALAVGFLSTCAIVNGGVKCWGRGSSGRIGNSDTRDSSVPVDVLGLGPGSGVTDVSTSSSHTCAVVNAGVRCWGNNSSGQLGNGTRESSAVPVEVLGIGTGSGATDVVVGDSHTCAIVRGDVYCWGNNGNGTLGDGSGKLSTKPVGVLGLSTPGGITASTTTTTTASSKQNLRFTQNPYLPDSRSPDSRPSQCPIVMILGFRGSGEKPYGFLVESPKTLLKVGQKYSNWRGRTGFAIDRNLVAEKFRGAVESTWYDNLFGSTVGQHVEQLRFELAQVKGIPVSDVGIWSVGVDDIHLTDVTRNGIPQPIYQAAGVEYSLKDLASGRFDYLESILTDSLLLATKNLFQKYTRNICPSVREVYAVGYSQGAIFARQAMAEIMEDSPSKARGLLLLADPLFRYQTEGCCFHYTFALNHVFNDEDADGVGHIRFKVGSSRIKLWENNSLAGLLELIQLDELAKQMNVITVCVAKDIVCAIGRGSSKAIHSNSYKRPKSTTNMLRYRVAELTK